MTTTEWIYRSVQYDNDFDRKYRNYLSSRWPTLRVVLNLFLQRRLAAIVETGCVRLKDDWGAGYSTVVFADFLSQVPNGFLFSVDIDERNVKTANNLTEPWANHRSVICADSAHYLQSFGSYHHNDNPQIDLLYLDSLDYPILDVPQNSNLPEDEIYEKYFQVLDPCQQHALRELKAAWPFLHEKSIVLLDDNNLPGGGKTRLAKHYLFGQGWTCLLDHQQSVWVK